MKTRYWKTIPRYETLYELSDDGYIRSLAGVEKGIERRPKRKNGTQLNFSLYRESIRKCISAFRLLAITFLDADWSDKRFLALPKDGNLYNVTLDNVLLLKGDEVGEFYKQTSKTIMEDYLKIANMQKN